MDGKLNKQPDWQSRLEAFERRGPLERLGLEKGATDAQIKHARNQILKKFHPDAGAQDTPYNRGIAALVNEAYEYLSGKKPLELGTPGDTSPLYSWEKLQVRPRVRAAESRDPFGFERNNPRDNPRWVDEMFRGANEPMNEGEEARRRKRFDDILNDIFGTGTPPGASPDSRTQTNKTNNPKQPRENPKLKTKSDTDSE